jgi:hypothetical protein
MFDGYPTLTADPQRDPERNKGAGKGAGIVCRTCGAEEGVFVVLRSSCPSQKQGSCPPGSESGTTYECQACVDQSCLTVDEALDSWLRGLFSATPT